VFEEMTVVTQVLDGTCGMSAVGVRARLGHASGGDWTTVAEAETDADGQISDWDGRHLERGLYRIVIDSDSYFASMGASSAYPEVTVIFRMLNRFAKSRVLVALSPYSYSTYFCTIDKQSEDSLSDGTVRQHAGTPIPGSISAATGQLRHNELPEPSEGQI
jgi:5-hydroxyisourate hydrolase